MEIILSKISQTLTAKFHMCVSEGDESSLGKIKGISQRAGVGKDKKGKVRVEEMFSFCFCNK